MSISGMSAALVLVLIPIALGWPVRGLLSPFARLTRLEELTVAFFVGLGCFNLISTIAHFAHLSLLWLAVLTGATGVLSWSFGRRRIPQVEPMALAACLGIGLVALSYFVFGLDLEPSGDGFRHLGTIRRIFSRGVVDPEVIFWSRELPFDPRVANYSFNFFYPLYSLAAWLVRADIVPMWVHLPGAYIPLYVGAVILLVRSCELSPLSVSVVAWTVIGSGFVFGNEFLILNYPGHVGRVFLVFLLANLIQLLKQEPPSSMRWGFHAILVGSLINLHVQFLIYYFFSLGLILLVCVLRDRSKIGRLFGYSLLSGLVILPTLIPKWRYFLAVRGESTTIAGIQFDPAQMYSFFGLPAVNPLKIISPLVWWGLAASLLLLVWRRRAGKTTALPQTIAFTSLIAFPLVAALPVTNLFLGSFLSHTILNRSTLLTETWSWVMLAGLLATVTQFDRFAVWSRLLGGLFVIFCGVAVAWPGSRISPVSWQRQEEAYAKLYGATFKQIGRSEALLKLFQSIPVHARVLTDAKDLLIAYRDIVIVGDPSEILLKGKKINDRLSPVFRPETPLTQLREILDTHDVEFILLSPFTSNLAWVWPHELFERVAEAHVEVGQGNDDYQLLRYRRLGDAVNPRLGTTTCARPILLNYSATSDVSPTNASRNELAALHDGRWDTGAESVIWTTRPALLRINFELPEIVSVSSVRVRSHFFTENYYLDWLGLFGEDEKGNFLKLAGAVVGEEAKPGYHEWNFDSLRFSGRKLRLAVQSRDNTPIGEVEVMGCVPSVR